MLSLRDLGGEVVIAVPEVDAAAIRWPRCRDRDRPLTRLLVSSLHCNFEEQAYLSVASTTSSQPQLLSYVLSLRFYGGSMSKVFSRISSGFPEVRAGGFVMISSGWCSRASPSEAYKSALLRPLKLNIHLRRSNGVYEAHSAIVSTIAFDLTERVR